MLQIVGLCSCSPCAVGSVPFFFPRRFLIDAGGRVATGAADRMAMNSLNFAWVTLLHSDQCFRQIRRGYESHRGVGCSMKHKHEVALRQPLR